MIKTTHWLLLLLMILGTETTSADVQFGRLYTTPKQREHLDELRSRKSQEPIIVPVTETQLPQQVEQEQIGNTSSITLDGIVYRSDGKNTAWINRNSTNSGNLENQYTRINERDVRSNEVRITLPNDQQPVELKVGQQYDVHTGQVRDLMKDATNATPASDEP